MAASRRKGTRGNIKALLRLFIEANSLERSVAKELEELHPAQLFRVLHEPCFLIGGACCGRCWRGAIAYGAGPEGRGGPF